MRSTFLFSGMCVISFMIISCGSNETKTSENTTPATSTPSSDSNTSPSDEAKGTGKFKNVDLTHPLDEKMIATGKGIFDMKCGSCHKLTDEKLVGPGWKGVTERRKPEWIMNFVTNTEEMLEKNATAKSLYEVCLVKMPNQNLTDDDARGILEFMRKNDGQK